MFLKRWKNNGCTFSNCCLLIKNFSSQSLIIVTGNAFIHETITCLLIDLHPAGML